MGKCLTRGTVQPMQRRKFLATVGSLAAGSAAAMGTSAYSQMVSGDRAISIEVADDSSAYVALMPWKDSNGDWGPNAAYAGGNGDERGGADSYSSGEESFEYSDTLELDFTSNNPNQFSFGGNGVNEGSEYEFDNVFEIVNYGTQDVSVWLTKSNLPGVYFYGTRDGKGTDPSNGLVGIDNRTGNVSVSQSVGVGVKIVEDELPNDGLGTVNGFIQVHAQVPSQISE